MNEVRLARFQDIRQKFDGEVYQNCLKQYEYYIGH